VGGIVKTTEDRIIAAVLTLCTAYIALAWLL
jgi:hypothetical protein